MQSARSILYLYLKTTRIKAGRVAQVVDLLPRKSEALSPNPSTTNPLKTIKKKQRKHPTIMLNFSIVTLDPYLK
jgi:hypothetical protein